MKKIVYLTGNEEREIISQSFSPFEDEYTFDSKKGILVKVGVIDLQERVNSFSDCALDKILEKFTSFEDLPNVQIDNESVCDVSSSFDLSTLGSFYENVDNYKEKFNLPISFTPEQVFEFLEKTSRDLNKIISDKKGCVEDAKKD